MNSIQTHAPVEQRGGISNESEGEAFSPIEAPPHIRRTCAGDKNVDGGRYDLVDHKPGQNQ